MANVALAGLTQGPHLLPVRRLAERTRASARLLALAVRLAWRASPPLLLGIGLLSLVQAALPLVQLALTKAVLDRLLELAQATPLAAGRAQLPLGAWIALAALAVGASRVIHPLSAACEALAGDRLTGHVTGQLIRAANAWPGIARFEDPSFAEDLRIARERASKAGLTLAREGAHCAAALFGAAGLAVVLAALHPLAPIAIALCAVPATLWQWEYQTRTATSLYVRTPQARRLRYYARWCSPPSPPRTCGSTVSPRSSSTDTASTSRTRCARSAQDSFRRRRAPPRARFSPAWWPARSTSLSCGKRFKGGYRWETWPCTAARRCCSSRGSRRSAG